MANGIIANSIVNALAGFMLLITGFASAIVTARLLGPEANGIIAFSLWLVVSGASIAELGSSVMLLKMMPQLKAQGFSDGRRRGFAAILITPTLFAVLVLLALYAVFFLTSERFHWSDATAPSVALVTGMLFVVQAIGSFSKFYLIGEKRLGSFFKLTCFVSAVQLGGVLFGSIYYGVEGALIGYAAGQVVLFVATMPIIFAKRDACDIPRNYLTSSSTLISMQFIIEAVFLNRLELLFLQQFWSVKMVGFYAAGLSVANMALQVPIQLTGSLLPYYSERRHEAGGSGLSPSVIAGVTRALSYITLPMSLGLAAISQELVETVFGPAFREAGPTVALLALAAPGAAFMQTLSLYLLSQDRTKERLVISVVASAFLVAGCLAFVPFFAGEGAAAVRVAVFIIMCALMIRFLKFGADFKELYVSLAKVGLASAACGLAAFGVLAVHSGPIGLLLAIAAGAVVYVPALRLFRAVPEEDADLLRGSTARLGRFAPLAERVVDFVVPRTLESTASEMVFAPVVNATIEGVGRPAAIPVVFANTLGHFLPEDVDAVKQDTAVLLLSPWGYDDMCLRKSYRILAERLAAAGIPSLRFDYPGTGDAIDGTDFSAGLKVWENAARDAVARLRELSHVSRVILIGQGIGATLAHRIAKDASDITAVAMLAPVTNGRSYLREVAFRAKFIYEDLGLKDAQRDLAGVSVAGLRMPEAIAADVRKLNVTQVEANAAHYLIIERSVKMGDTQLLDGLLGASAEASQREYIGYDALMTMPLTAREPIEVIEGLVEWATTMTQAAAPGIASDTVLPEQVLTGDGYVERPLRFGALNNLTGVACLPGNGPAEGTSVLLLSTAYDRHSGWGGTNVDMARQLARRGIASLRYDSANVADSPPSPDAPDRILYSDTQNRDAIAALDVLETFKPGPMMVAGRCSGAYIAFRTALQDKRLSAVIAVNPFVFYWNPAEKVPEDISIVPRSLNDYGTRFTRLETVKRLFKGEVNVRAAMRNMVVAAWRRLSFRLAPLLMYLPGRHVVAKEVKQTFSAYERANIPVTVMYSEADVGLEHLYFHFGANGRKLQRYKNVRLIFMPATDHNLTPLPAREKLFEEIVRLTGTPPAQPDQNRDEPAQKHENALDIHAAIGLIGLLISSDNDRRSAPMGPPVDAVPTSPEFPTTADVVIIGGGIIGVSAALFLARQGVSVVLCEKGHVAGEQSSRNWGWVRRMGRDPRELALIVKSMDLWDGMQQFVGEDVGFRRTGIAYLCAEEKDIPHHEEWLRNAGDFALDTKMISGAALAAILPGAARTYPAALYTGSDGRAEPQKAAPAIARAAIRAGATILQQCAVRGIETAGGHISGVVTERGTIRATTVVVAGGAWSSALVRSLGIHMPQLVVRSSVMRTAPVEGGPEGAAWADGYAYRKRLDGGYTIAEGTISRHEIVPDSFRYLGDFLPMILREWRDMSLRISPDFGARFGRDYQKGLFYEHSRTLDPAPINGYLEKARAKLEKVFPVFKGVPTAQSWAGYIDATPDAVPVIAPVQSLPGLIIATGFSGHGFGIGPGAGHLVADIATGATPIVDPTPFRYERFIDGTKHRPSTGV